MVICFCPGRLGAKPDALTRQWDIYPKEGDTHYAQLNPHNFRPVFTQEQLSASLCATFLEGPVLCASIIMDVEKLHEDIRTPQSEDESLCNHFREASNTSAKSDDSSESRWMVDESGFLRLDNRIFVPDAKDLKLRILQQYHDHILAGHFGQNWTLENIRQQYTWPLICEFVQDYVWSCVACARNKVPHHKPYGLLHPLPVPERPWESISMDFIEELPNSNSYNSILVIIDCASKQAIFISTDIHITSKQLAQLFILHVFSKHGIPNHVTSDRGSEFIFHFM